MLLGGFDVGVITEGWSFGLNDDGSDWHFGYLSRRRLTVSRFLLPCWLFCSGIAYVKRVWIEVASLVSIGDDYEELYICYSRTKKPTWEQES